MSVTRIARAPTSYSSSMTWLVRARGTMARTATQPLSCNGETVGDSRPGRQRTGALDVLDPHVVVHQHVLPGDQHALQASGQHVDLRVRLGAAAADQDRLGLQDRLAEDLQPGGPQGRCRSRPRRRSRRRRRAYGALDRAVEPDDLGASTPCSARCCATSPG